MMEDRQEKIHNLRALLQEKFGSAQACVSSSRKNGDELDLKPVKQGTVCEIVAASASSGVGLSIERLLDQSKEKGHVALIDGRDSFDPSLVGYSLSQLLWLRCRNVPQAIKSADWLLRDGNLSLVVLDLQLNPPHETRRIPASSWYRLRALAEETNTTLFVFSAEKLLPCAHVRWLLREGFSISAMDEIREEISLNAAFEKDRPQVVPLIAKTG